MIDIQEEQFDAEVLEASRRQPILVDFWAPWCGPCRMLSPVLERLAVAYQGQLRMVKINADHAPKLSQRYAVRSIPAVLLFRNAKLVDQFTGAKPEAQIRQFIQRHLPRPEDADLASARQLRDKGEFEAASQAFARVLDLRPDHLDARSELVQCLLEQGNYAGAVHAFEPLRALLHSDPARSDPRIAHLAVFVEAGEALANRPPEADGEAPSGGIREGDASLEQRFLVAQRHMVAAQWPESIDLLLGILAEDRKFAADRVRKCLLAIFARCPDSALVGQSRRRMSSLLN